MESKTRVGAIIIEKSKLLMVKGRNYDEIWTPGGKKEHGESDLDCLKRELKEELNVELSSHKFFGRYESKSFYHDYLMINRMYLVSIKGNIMPGMEIEKYFWLDKKDFLEEKFSMIPIIREKVLPDLIEQNYW